VIDESSTLEDVCFEVSGALDRHSISGVLTGGSAATVYASGAYSSLDADFVLRGYPARKRLEQALAEVGFVRTAMAGMYANARTIFTVDFPRGPLAVGGEYIHETATLVRNGLSLRILTVTDCVRDRLAAFYHWSDYTSLNAAVAVARVHRDRVNFARIREWTEREGGPALEDHRFKYEEFLKRLGN
jgi:hypothetical protein